MINSLMPVQIDQMYSHTVNLKVGIGPFADVVAIKYKDNSPLWETNVNTHIKKMVKIGAIKWPYLVSFNRHSGFSIPPLSKPYRYHSIEFICNVEAWSMGQKKALEWLKGQYKPVDASEVNVGDTVTYERWGNKRSSSKVIRINKKENTFKLDNGRTISGNFIDSVNTNN